jgi:hypothetical protein
MRLIIEENGNKSWLTHGTPHCDVRQDYVNTRLGLSQNIPHKQIYNLCIAYITQLILLLF